MEYVVHTLGLGYLQTFKTRNAITPDNGGLHPRQSQTVTNKSEEHNMSKKTFIFGANYPDPVKREFFDCCDDDTTECTVLTMDDGSVSSSSSSTVSFAEPLITNVHERPFTLPSEKQTLFYTDCEYRKFRRDFHRMRKNGFKTVHFSDSLVSGVWTLPPNDNKNELFYTENELRNFLEDFIVSLNKDENNEMFRS